MDSYACQENVFETPSHVISVSSLSTQEEINKHPSSQSSICADKSPVNNLNNSKTVEDEHFKNVSDRLTSPGRSPFISFLSSFSRLGLCPGSVVKNKTRQVCEPQSPGIDVFLKSPRRRCHVCSKKKKKLFSDNVSFLVTAESDGILLANNSPELTAVCSSVRRFSSISIGSEACLNDCLPSQDDDVSASLESYAQTIQAIQSTDRLSSQESSVSVPLEAQTPYSIKLPATNTLDSTMYAQSPVKVCIKQNVLTKSIEGNSSKIMSPYSPPSSVLSCPRDNERQKMNCRVRKKIFTDKCDVCHRYLDDPLDVKKRKIQTKRSNSTKSSAKKNDRVSNQMIQRDISESISFLLDKSSRNRGQIQKASKVTSSPKCSSPSSKKTSLKRPPDRSTSPPRRRLTFDTEQCFVKVEKIVDQNSFKRTSKQKNKKVVLVNNRPVSLCTMKLRSSRRKRVSPKRLLL